MFLHHNGHQLSQIDDALRVILSKLENFDKVIEGTKMDNNEVQNLLITCRLDIESAMNN